MAKGIIYTMTTVVPGLIKIGKTGSNNFEQRMYNLEHNGYSNVVGLKRHFAIEVEDYDEKELMLDDIFSKSRVENTELFAVDINMVVQLLSSFEGTQVYPKPEEMSKEEVFDEAVFKREGTVIPDGIYTLARKPKDATNFSAKMQVLNGEYIVLAGSNCIPYKEREGKTIPKVIKDAVVIDGILKNDVKCNSPSTAGILVLGMENNGWVTWKDENGKYIDEYRKNKDSGEKS